MNEQTGEPSIAPSEPAAPVPNTPGRMVRLLNRTPQPVIAVCLILPVLLICDLPWLRYLLGLEFVRGVGFTLELLFWMMLFLPGAIKRRRGLQILAMLIGGAVAFGVSRGLWELSPPHYNWLAAVGIDAVSIYLLGLCELRFNHRLSWRAVIWIAACSLSIAAILQLVTESMVLVGWGVRIPIGDGGFVPYSVAQLLRLPLLTLLAWTIIPLCIGFSPPRSSRGRYALAGFCVLSFVTTALFMQVLSYRLAERSLLDDGPFSRASSVRWLFTRGTDSDLVVIWTALQQANWYEPPDTDDVSYNNDWRQVAINALSERDSARTAKRLSRLFRRVPSEILACDAADLFARHLRYETVPLLMRYALAKSDFQCGDAIEKMKLPIAAFAIMRQAVVDQAKLFGDRLEYFSDDTRQRLVHLLGHDAGPKIDDWAALYDKIIDDVQTPLPKPIRDDTTRVISAWLKFHNADEDWAERCLEKAKREGLTDDALRKKTRKLIESVRPPDWDVKTTDELEKEIDAYVIRVSKAMQQSITLNSSTSAPSRSRLSPSRSCFTPDTATPS